MGCRRLLGGFPTRRRCLFGGLPTRRRCLFGGLTRRRGCHVKSAIYESSGN